MARGASVRRLWALVVLACRASASASAADDLVLLPYLSDDRQRLPVMDGPSSYVGASACFVMDDGDIFVMEAPPGGGAPSSDGTWALDSKERFFSVPSGLKGTRFVGARSWGHLFGLTDAGEIVIFFYQANDNGRRRVGCYVDPCPFVAGVLPGPFLEIAHDGPGTLCAVRSSDGEVQCFEIPPQVAEQRPSSAPWVDLTGLLSVPARMCNTLACATTDGPYVNVKTLTSSVACAVRRSDGTVRCWGTPTGSFRSDGILPYTNSFLPSTTGVMSNGQNPVGWPRLRTFAVEQSWGGGFRFIFLPENRSEFPKYGTNNGESRAFEGSALPMPVPLVYTGGESGFIGGNRGIDARGGFWSSFAGGNRNTWEHCDISLRLRSRFDCGEYGPVTYSFENHAPPGIGTGGISCILPRNSNLPDCDAFINYVDSAKQEQKRQNFRAFWLITPASASSFVPACATTRGAGPTGPLTPRLRCRATTDTTRLQWAAALAAGLRAASPR